MFPINAKLYICGTQNINEYKSSIRKDVKTPHFEDDKLRFLVVSLWRDVFC